METRILRYTHKFPTPQRQPFCLCQEKKHEWTFPNTSGMGSPDERARNLNECNPSHRFAPSELFSSGAQATRRFLARRLNGQCVHIATHGTYRQEPKTTQCLSGIRLGDGLLNCTTSTRFVLRPKSDDYERLAATGLNLSRAGDELLRPWKRGLFAPARPR